MQAFARGPHLRVLAGITVITSGIVAMASTALWLIERQAVGTNITNFPDALWWAMETVTTVGYGDHHPVTTGGRLVAGGLMVTGVALVGVMTATIVTWFFAELDIAGEFRAIEREEEQEEQTLDQILARLDAIEVLLARPRPEAHGDSDIVQGRQDLVSGPGATPRPTSSGTGRSPHRR